MCVCFPVGFPSRSLDASPTHSQTQTLSADDVLAALTDAGFDELAAPLRDELTTVTADRAAATKKRKADTAAETAAAE